MCACAYVRVFIHICRETFKSLTTLANEDTVIRTSSNAVLQKLFKFVNAFFNLLLSNIADYRKIASIYRTLPSSVDY